MSQHKKLAYEAGHHALSEPPERRTPNACPFDVDSEERAEWLRGFGDALDEQPDISALRQAVKEAR